MIHEALLHSSVYEMVYQNMRYRYYEWTAKIWINYSGIFKDPLDIPGFELPGGQSYYYYHTWTDLYRRGFGVVVLE